MSKVNIDVYDLINNHKLGSTLFEEYGQILLDIELQMAKLRTLRPKNENDATTIMYWMKAYEERAKFLYHELTRYEEFVINQCNEIIKHAEIHEKEILEEGAHLLNSLAFVDETVYDNNPISDIADLVNDRK